MGNQNDNFFFLILQETSNFILSYFRKTLTLSYLPVILKKFLLLLAMALDYYFELT